MVKKGDKIIQTVDINKTDPKGNVLPDSTRRFEVKLDKIGAWGKYTVEGNFGYGTSGQLLSGKSTIYVVPATLIIAIIALLLLIVAATGFHEQSVATTLTLYEELVVDKTL